MLEERAREHGGHLQVPSLELDQERPAKDDLQREVSLRGRHAAPAMGMGGT